MQVAIALYKGPSDNINNRIVDCLIRLRLFSRYSHAELVIGGTCYSSSIRDKGVRSKYINYLSDKWDVYYFDITQEEYANAINWFELNKGKAYDWTNIFRYVFPFLKQRKDKYICFEAVASMLGISDAYKATPRSLIEYVKLKNEGQVKH